MTLVQAKCMVCGRPATAAPGWIVRFPACEEHRPLFEAGLGVAQAVGRFALETPRGKRAVQQAAKRLQRVRLMLGR